jgi:hypothetical protein
MNGDAKIYVAGHQGLVGSALVRQLRALDNGNILMRSHQELDLADPSQVREFFARRELVFDASKPDGLHGNCSAALIWPVWYGNLRLCCEKVSLEPTGISWSAKPSPQARGQSRRAPVDRLRVTVSVHGVAGIRLLIRKRMS